MIEAMHIMVLYRNEYIYTHNMYRFAGAPCVLVYSSRNYSSVLQHLFSE